MERMSTWELRRKDVINLCDGRILGCPDDFEIDVRDGKIIGLIVSQPSGFFCLSHDKDIVIPWNKIECVGNDAILVRVSVGECNYFPDKRKKGKC